MRNNYILVLCLLVSLSCAAQRKSRKTGFNQPNAIASSFLQKQWWLGFKAGPNLSKAIVDKTYQVVSPINYDAAAIGKRYENFKSVGSQVTFEVTFYFRRLSLSFQPTYRTGLFSYTNAYEWGDPENPVNRLTLDYHQRQKVAWFDWPLIAKYEFQAATVTPYIQAGIYSSLLLDATKSVEVSGIDYASGGEHRFENEPVIVGATDLFAKYHWGIVGGGGVYYPLGNVRLNLDVVYRVGMSNISATRNRYGSDRLSGVGDSLDDMTLNNISVSVGCLFPLRFLGSGFKSMID